MLVGHLPDVDKRNLPDDFRTEVILPDVSGAFPKAKAESRQKLIFDAIKKVWSFNN